jgi:hypothetical protein
MAGLGDTLPGDEVVFRLMRRAAEAEAEAEAEAGAGDADGWETSTVRVVAGSAGMSMAEVAALREACGYRGRRETGVSSQ